MKGLTKVAGRCHCARVTRAAALSYFLPSRMVSDGVTRTGSVEKKQALLKAYQQPSTVAARGVAFRSDIKAVTIIDAPVSGGGPLSGAELGPDSLRRAHLSEVLSGPFGFRCFASLGLKTGMSNTLLVQTLACTT